MQALSSRSNWLIPVILGLIVTVLIAFVGLMLKNYEVLEKGQLLDYTNGLIYKVRIFDKYTFFVELERHRLDRDVFNSYLLSGIAFISLTYAFLLFQFKRDPTKEKTF